MWARHDRKKDGSFIQTTIKENPFGNRPLGRPHIRWKDRVIKYVKAVEPNIQWRELAKNGERWRQICLRDWS